jgi:hypothetical protein
MKVKSIFVAMLVVILATSVTFADDGQMHRRNVSKTPLAETERAAMAMMQFYVPAQASSGDLLEGIEYYDAEGGLVETREYAQPVVAVYIDNQAEEVVDGESVVMGGTSIGEHDAFAALSLDDGATWKRSNLSQSSDLSSFTLRDGHPYPGDAHYVTVAVADEKVLVAFLSKYCVGGDASYTLDDTEKEALAAFLEVDVEDLYLNDIFGVAGSQGSVDYTALGFPEVGELPYSCVWAARGTLEPVDAEGNYDETGEYHNIIWRKAERLTSGRRDANRLEIAGVSGAGFIMVWQEDPEGLRPGQGLGPGEGWSGAIVNQKTDIWYSHIGWDHFDLIDDDDDTATDPILLVDFDGDTTPKVGVPMALPVRLSDNNMCKNVTDSEAQNYQAYCIEDWDLNDTPDLCATTVSLEKPEGTIEVCQTEDGRVLWGRNGASRPRINLQPYDSDGDEVNDSAWVIMAYEELKALGEGSADDEEPIDIGKNIWYHSFDMFNPEMVAQGGQLNHPARCPTDDIDGCAQGEFFPFLYDEWGNEFYETEIARRFNLMTQHPDKAGESGLLGILMYKQGIINQGGPADIFLRRLVLPDEFDPQVDNPYAYENIFCENWVYEDGSNPRYVEGLCLDTGINVSATSIVECSEASEDCAADFPWDGVVDGQFPKVTQWMQTEENLGDEAWTNPFDVSKGHRGFLDGDIVMQMYAWSPNWKANSVGNDHYNLYIRRSFDGGLTWTTTPGDLGGTGTCSTENYLYDGVGEDGSVEYCYGAGEFEQARNVSQLIGTKITILDPRYTPTPGSITKVMEGGEIVDTGTFMYLDDERDPSKFFVVYETGDNTTVTEGEATPLDLFYSRASVYGDVYDVIEKEVDGEEVVEVWDWLEHEIDDLSGEASVTTNPGGTFFYSVWNQWKEDEHEHVFDSDCMFRRVMYLDDTDALPTATILYTSHRAGAYDRGDVLTFIGTAVDNDHMGEAITAYRWISSIDGVIGYDQILNIPVTDLSLGVHTISFTALDGEGNWAAEKTLLFLVGESLYEAFLPKVGH